MKNKQGVLVEEDKEMTNIIGDYFKDVFTEVPTGEMPEMNRQCEKEIEEIQICRGTLQNFLEKLNVN